MKTGGNILPVLLWLWLWLLPVAARDKADGAIVSMYEITPLPFNTSYADNVATISGENELIYCSNRRQHLLTGWLDRKNENLFRLYRIRQKNSLHWDAPVPVQGRLVENAHLGPASLSADKNTLYFTANRDSINGIYAALRSGNAWGGTTPFTHNSPLYRTAHPSLSSDGKRLFFASDMPGGLGGFDIYYCQWTDAGWDAPKNLGAEVNTPADELYPSIRGNGMLFFSSAGHNSMGGLDIFSVKESPDGRWVNLQPADDINSKADDVACIASNEEGTAGYFSSNRNGKNMKIFGFKSLFFDGCKEQIENDYTYEFFEPSVIDSGATTTFFYEWSFSDGAVLRGEAVEHTFAAPGVYLIQLNVIDALTGELESRAADYELEVTEEEQPYITAVETARTGESVTLDASQTHLPGIRIDGYFWMTGDGGQKKGKTVQYNYVEKGTYRIQLGIKGIREKTGESVNICTCRNITIH
ncbi:MAG: PKD domain-containing protein [Bacteroidales bacterium]|jgi:hypothetical protein|nr:PKD domain-containing protein [Bacteroidales bacterium]